MISDSDVITLLNHIISENGQISIQFCDDLERPAKYDFSKNQILLRRNQNLSLENMVPYIFFELQNAKQHRKFLDLNQQILIMDKERYVEEVEKLEHNTSIITHLYVNTLAKRGILSKNAPYYYCFLNFEDHYLYQQLSGHSQMIANQHLSEKPYRGTWVTIPSDQERPILKNLLNFKALTQLGTPDEQLEAKGQITLILEKINCWLKNSPFSPLVASLHQNVNHILYQK